MARMPDAGERTVEEYRAIEAILDTIREVGDGPTGRHLLRILLDVLDYFDALRAHAAA